MFVKHNQSTRWVQPTSLCNQTGREGAVRNLPLPQQPSYRALSPKLPQMMIQMFVHPAAPLRRRQVAEEWMRMFRAPAFTADMKLPDFRLELLLLAQEVPRVGHDEFRVGRIFLEKGFSFQ